MIGKNELLHRLHEHDPLALALVGIAGFIWVFLPTLIAGLRRHPSFRLIALINLVFFWEFWMWVPLMAWAFMDRPGDALVARFERLGGRIRNVLQGSRRSR
ncbi:superinfection immunity protein [Asaia lannensis]|uniref:Superinfection immunity protein n=1 Tax=Asaia lannensis NBRC 102526 TaxID=1307926 RepID=A0ABT1CE84_9PROT|nr:superinfection immunity protein [Asaia lannensis]MCO6159081.1 superinfection immunity protein [Asaia lannensis NBRC 102526]GBQ96786.1 hypothetical protein AA102526_0928 [Asaia lannensis NBRC 102526]